MQKIITWLEEHPAINKSEIERIVGMPKRTLHNAMLPPEKGGKSLPEKWIEPLEAVLSDYGYTTA